MERIGRGAMGEVWAARDRRSRRDVAVKLAQGWSIEMPELRDRFEREAKVMSRIDNPHVCAVLGAGTTDDGAPFIVLERLRGESLEELLAREGTLPLGDVAWIGEHVLSGLVAAHEAGVVHRDLSPSNVFLHDDEGEGTVAKLLDFGIAKAQRTTTGAPRTGTGSAMGTLTYAAPEQLTDSARAGPRADLYAAGAVFFRALAGCPPFGDARGVALVVMKREHDPPTIDEVTGEQWPAQVRAFLSKMMARTPNRRYASAQVALEAFRSAIKGRGPRIEVAAPQGSTPRLTRRRPGARSKSRG